MNIVQSADRFPAGNPGAIHLRRTEDSHHPRMSGPHVEAETRKLLNRKIAEQDRKCPICHEEFTDYDDIALGHRDPKEWEDELGRRSPTQMSEQRIGGVEKGSTRVDG
jgi:hypothetical protein